jgi:GntP family gluconate:H+ symporter
LRLEWSWAGGWYTILGRDPAQDAEEFVMQPVLLQLLPPLAAIVLLVLLITKVRLHPFLALVLAAGFLGLVAGLSPADTVKHFQKGFGSILGSVGLVVGLGAMLGGLLLDSGGADRIANVFIGDRGTRWIPVSICAAALLIGLPHLFDVSFVMLVPLVYTIAHRSRSHILRVGLPVAAGLYVSHGLLPPHPSPTLAMATFHADAGRTIFYGALIAIPMAIISGPLFTMAAMRWLPRTDSSDKHLLPGERSAAAADDRPTASFALAVITILLPPGLMMLRTFASPTFAEGSVPRLVLDGIGNPLVSLLVAVLFAIWALGMRTGRSMGEIQKLLGKSVAPVAGVILILGAGGGLKEMLTATHVSDLIAHHAMTWQIDPLLLAWGVAALIRIAVGSATVATVAAAGIVAPLAGNAGVSAELLVLATSSGSLMLSHVNDSGFWLFKEYFQLSVAETFKSWTLLVSLQSIIGLIGVLALRALFG